MKRYSFCLLLAVCTASSAAAQNVAYFSSNNVLALSASAAPLTMYVEYEARIKVVAMRSGSPQDLSNTFIRWTITDRRDNTTVRDVDGFILGDPTDGISIASTRFDDLEPGLYLGTLAAYDVANSNKVTDLSLNNITLINWCDGCDTGGGGVSLALSLTNPVTVASSGTGNVVTSLTASGSVVTEHRGTVEGGGGAALPVNGSVPTSLTFNASYPFTVTTVTNDQGMTITYGLSGSAGTVVIPDGNTSTSFIYYVDTNAQFYTAAPIATQLLFFAIGSAAGTSAGGLAMRYVACTGSQVFACYAPQGGLALTNATAEGGWGYIKGGDAKSTNGNVAVSGAGSLAVLTGTNVILHLGGPGGCQSAWSRANGGGLTGYSYGSVNSGGGGGLTNHGAAATAFAGATAGSYDSGGFGTSSNGLWPGCGGGGGPFSGGGGCANSSTIGGPGGAGSTVVYDGYTARSAPDSASPPSTDHDLYRSPHGVGLTTTVTNNNRGNPGYIAIVSYPSP